MKNLADWNGHIIWGWCKTKERRQDWDGTSHMVYMCNNNEEG